MISTMNEKLTERVALPMSREMLGAVRSLAKQGKRKYLEQIRMLIERGLAAEQGEESALLSRLDRIEKLITRQDTAIDDLAMIPLLEFKAAAGGGGLIESERVLDELAFKRSWIKSKLRANVADLIMIKVSGPSMEPTLLGDDLVMVDTSQKTIKHDQIYVLRGEDGKLVKRLCLKHGGLIEIHSDNLDPTYHLPAMKLSELSPRIIGRVVWAARRL